MKQDTSWSLMVNSVAGYVLSAWEALKQRESGQGGVSDDQELALALERGTLSAAVRQVLHDLDGRCCRRNPGLQ